MKGQVWKRCPCGVVRDDGGKVINCPKRHGTWYLRFDLPKAPDGKRRQVKEGGYATEREAREALNDALSRLTRGTYVEQRRVTVGEYLDEWLAGKESLRATTRRSYAEHINLYLQPGLGHIRLTELRPADISDLYRAMRDLGTDVSRPDPTVRRLLAARKGERAVKALTPARIRRVHATLNSALNSALRRQLVGLNPAAHVELPTGKRPRAVVWTDERVAAWKAGRFDPPAVAVWTPKQLGAFLDHANADRLYALYHLIAFRGLRRGEAVGLPWSDVDLDAGTLTVGQQIVQVGWATERGAPKTESGERVVALDAQTVAVLRAHRAAQHRERLAWGEAYQDSGLVFTREDGSELHPDYVTRHFDRLATAAGLPPIRLHDLRHGAATLALAGGVDPKIVQAMLGHSSITITLDTYTSVLPEVAVAAAEAAAALVPRAAVATSTAGDVPNPCPPEVKSPARRLARKAKAQVRPGGPPGDRTLNPRIKRAR